MPAPAKCQCGMEFTSPSRAAEHYHSTDHRQWSIPSSWMQDRPWTLDGMFAAIRDESQEVAGHVEAAKDRMVMDPGFFKLATAAAHSDARSEELEYDGYIASLGLDHESLVDVCEQRAMRALLVLRMAKGDQQAISDQHKLRMGEGFRFDPTPEERAMLPTLLISVMDGIVIGMTLRDQEFNSYQEKGSDG